jgi:hypothetical protein
MSLLAATTHKTAIFLLFIRVVKVKEDYKFMQKYLCHDVDWSHAAKDRDQWRFLVSTAGEYQLLKRGCAA